MTSVWVKPCAVASLSLLLVSCGNQFAAAPTGTWKDVASNRYMSIEFVPNSTTVLAASTSSTWFSSKFAGKRERGKALASNSYNVRLYSYHEKGIERAYPGNALPEDGLLVGESREMSDNIMILERNLPASMEDGVLVLKAGITDISVLYHPSGELIYVNGVSEFRRIPDTHAPNT